MTPGKVYREIRNACGLTAAELASIIGVSLVTISQRENDRVAIGREAWLAIEHVAARKGLALSYTPPEPPKRPGPTEPKPEPERPAPRRSASAVAHAQPRNSRCGCGSGKKFKRCCGR